VWPELVRRARGDGRRALNLLEAVAQYAVAQTAAQSRAQQSAAKDSLEPAAAEVSAQLTLDLLQQFDESPALLYDKAGEEHYNVTSALIKSMRGSDPDAAIYWLMRMLEAGDDPLFVLRRLIIFASEDVGNADPRALQVACDADAAFRRLGMPEGLYPISQACLYLASCPKSNSVGKAFKEAQALIAKWGALPVPAKLRNPVTSLVREQGYGQNYRYAHDYPEHYVPGETYLPDQLTGKTLYTPSAQGLEISIGERLARLRGSAKGEPE
jgi:putative ATPase